METTPRQFCEEMARLEISHWRKNKRDGLRVSVDFARGNALWWLAARKRYAH